MSKQNNRLFVYGIFLGEVNRKNFGMSNPQYATVANYITVGDTIVQAVEVMNVGVALTGLTVDVDPTYWQRLDRLEGGYDRIIVTTTDGEPVNMYVAPINN